MAHRRTDRGGRDDRDRRDDGDRYADVTTALRSLHDETDAERRSALRAAAIERCLPLADHVARRFSGRGEPMDDLVQVARIGVVNAVDRFDVDRGADFLSFAVPTVMGEVRRHFRDSTWSMRVPRRAKEASLDIARASDELIQRLGRSPRPSEIARHLDIPVDDVIDGLLARSAYRSSSIDSEMDEGGGALLDTLGTDDERIARTDEFVTLQPILRRLPPRQQQILALRFFHSLSQSEIAVRVGCSQMHVSRLLSRTLAELREAVAADDRDEPERDEPERGGHP